MFVICGHYQRAANPPGKAGGRSREAMSEENKALARRSWEIVNQHNPDLDLIDEMYTPDFVWHEPDQDIQGSEEAKQFVATFLEAFPDLNVTVEDEIAEGDKVVTRWTIRGTHQGELMGIAPTEKQIELKGITIHRFEGDKIAEEWERYDNLGMMQQLGALPAQEGQQPPEQTEGAQEEEKGLIDKLKDKLRGQ
jgi:steroid delta-isomerase-like uncharacterized protein